MDCSQAIRRRQACNTNTLLGSECHGIAQSAYRIKQAIEPRMVHWIMKSDNDPSAGSPTETLLRLLLPLELGHRPSSQYSGLPKSSPETNPEASAPPPIGSSDGRCVQRAGT